MEKTYNPALIQRTQRYMETHSISQNQFAAKVNLSSAALSSYLNQKYKGSVEAVERQLSEFFKLDEEAEAPPRRPPAAAPRGVCADQHQRGCLPEHPLCPAGALHGRAAR